MLIKPAPGKSVRDPVTRLVIPEDGLEIVGAEHDLYWVRRLADGDVVEAKPTTATKAPAAKAKE
jgi:hypothetical protein